MLVHLIAFGVEGLISDDVEVGTGTITADADQTVAPAPGDASGGASSGLPISAPLWPRAFDPSDHAPYAYDFAGWMDEGETVADVLRITMSATGAALGVEIDSDAGFLPIRQADGTKVQVWVKVDDTFQGNAAFGDVGTQVGISFLISTSATPPRKYERTARLLVQQQ